LTAYPLKRLYEEAAYLAYHFHWSHQEIMNLEHWQRKAWCEEIAKINTRLNEEQKQ
jgi:hypothetical protein